MNQSFIKYGAAILFFSSICFMAGCATSGQNKLRNKIQNMSDADLLNYYYGINERIKNIDSSIKIKTDERSANSDYTEHDHIMSQEPFFIGGEAYQLNQERNLILKEMKSRDISP